jgi:hypothetical protein
MKSKLLLRSAAFFILMHFSGHLMGHLGWDKPKDPKMQEVVNTMKGYESQFMGATKSMADYFTGYSTMLFFVFGTNILVLWFASGFIETNRSIAAKVLYPFALCNLSFAVIEYIYFFPFAAAISFLAGMCTLAGIWVAKK